MKNVTIIDTTLRDGSHAVAHSFTPAFAEEVARSLSKAGCKYLEVAHGDGLGGSSFQYGLSKCDEIELIRAAKGAAGEMQVGALLLPGIGTVEHLKRAVDAGISFVRVATHVTEADVSQQHIRAAKSMGLFVVGFLMMSHMQPPEGILKQARLFEEYGADAVYCADSSGTMLPGDVSERISHLAQNLSLPVGFHAHNNLGLAIANSLAAVDAGAKFIDGTLRGLGAGAGNAPHEVLRAVFEKAGIDCGEALYPLMDAAEALIPGLGVQMTIDKAALTMGYAGVYGSFLLHARRASARYQVDERDILLELGRRKTVGGQEDLILEVAYKIAKQREGQA
jgi:4-hydroxy 2-oxovalerate aldolase